MLAGANRVGILCQNEIARFHRKSQISQGWLATLKAPVYVCPRNERSFPTYRAAQQLSIQVGDVELEGRTADG
jgi:hypothetical protein